MDLSNSQQAVITMPIPMNYSALHESKLKMLTAMSGGGDGLSDLGGNVAPVHEEISRPPEPAMVRKAVRYRECLKNHAAAMGGYAVDGCGEFMPSGEEGSLEALKCSACNCHRNFHRKEIEGEPPCYCFNPSNKDRKRLAPLALPHAPLVLPSSPVLSRPPHNMIMALSSGPSESEEHEIGIQQTSFPLQSHTHPGVCMPMMKKRFRTKFTSEQKEKMYAFAQTLGWRIQKHDEAAVQQFCVDVGVKRHVLKVWMHNNKNTLGKKLYTETFNPDPESV